MDVGHIELRLDPGSQHKSLGTVVLSSLIFSLLALPVVKLPLGGGTGGTWLLDSMVTVQPS